MRSDDAPGTALPSTTIDRMSTPSARRMPRLTEPSMLPLVFAALLPLTAAAQSHDLAAKVGTSGPGIEYSWGPAAMADLMPKYAFRASVNWGSYSRRTTRSGLAVKGSLEFQSMFLLADAYPFDNGFRASAGLMINGNRIVGRAVPAGDTVTINGEVYQASEVGSVEGKAWFARPAPYLGVGWGASPAGRPGFHFSFDFGAVYQRPDLRLTANCGPAVAPARCAELRADTAAEENDLRRDLMEGRIYPILNIGIGYRF